MFQKKPYQLFYLANKNELNLVDEVRTSSYEVRAGIA